jgi:hypothetical protein
MSGPATRQAVNVTSIRRDSTALAATKAPANVRAPTVISAWSPVWRQANAEYVSSVLTITHRALFGYYSIELVSGFGSMQYYWFLIRYFQRQKSAAPVTTSDKMMSSTFYKPDSNLHAMFEKSGQRRCSSIAAHFKKVWKPGGAM